MKRAILSLAAFFAAQLLATIAAVAYAFTLGKGPLTDPDESILVAGIAMLPANAIIVAVILYIIHKNAHGKCAEAKTGVEEHFSEAGQGAPTEDGMPIAEVAVQETGEIGIPEKDERRRPLQSALAPAKPHKHLTRDILPAVAAMLLLSFAESMILTPFDIDDPELQRMFNNMASSPLPLLNICLIGPMAEELVFRWGVLGGLRKRGLNVWLCIITSALCFAVVHGNLMQAVPAIFSGILLGVIYVRSGSLVPSIVAHIANNSLALVFMAHPEWEDPFKNLPAPVLIGIGAVLAALSVLFVLRIKTHEDRND